MSRSVKVRLTKKKNTRYEDINLSEKDIEGDQDNNYYVEIIGDQPDSSDIQHIDYIHLSKNVQRVLSATSERNASQDRLSKNECKNVEMLNQANSSMAT